MGKNFLVIIALFIAPLSPSEAAMEATVTLLQPSGDQARCSGVWVSKNTILTAAHCIYPDMRWTSHGSWVHFKPTRIFTTELLKVDVLQDLALCRALKPPTHTHVQLSFLPPTERERVFTIGSPYGIPWQRTDGIVTDPLRRGFPGRPDHPRIWIQAYIDVAPGNSGGGLFNTHGQLLGITSFYYEGSKIVGFVHWRSIYRMLH